jgi:iron complex transport system substrate-binding protein
MRIASLVPSATESLFALGFGDSVVAVTHECDWPEQARGLPQLTRSMIPNGLPAAEIDARVRELTARGEAIYGLDAEQLAALDADLIVTQALCAVCAVSYDEVCELAAGLPTGPDVISLDPGTIGEVLADLSRLAAACGDGENGERLREHLLSRLQGVRSAVAGLERPRVLALEWLDPPFIGGHWVPEMIEIAGGIDAIGTVGAKSRTAEWDELRDSSPDVVVAMPCGLYADDSAAAAMKHSDELARLGADRLFAVDAASSFSRPGPRLVEGCELLASLLHPGSIAPPPDVEWRELELPAIRR